MEHRLTPTRYFGTLGSHAPVARVRAGDTIITSTVDAGGFDQHGRHVTDEGNPQTGPIYIEQAQPGDTLVVRFERLRPNRSHGFCATALAGHVVEPACARQLPPRLRRQWRLDLQANTAAMEDPPPGLENLRVPLTPMLGCFGVAPPYGQAIGTATSGPFGGNMDYRGFGAGVTVHLPVFVEGALLFVGDGHAAQADGEVLGTGIEVSMEVTLGVDLLKGKTIHWPRGENAQAIFTVGNARPLEQALQHATTEMLRWLEKDFGLDASAANLLLGSFVRYEIANVFNPAYTVVCILARQALPQPPH